MSFKYKKKIQKSREITIGGEDVERRELLYTVGGNIKPLWKAVQQFLKKFKTELPYDPIILVLCVHPNLFLNIFPFSLLDLILLTDQ